CAGRPGEVHRLESLGAGREAFHQGISGAEADAALPAARYLGVDVRELAATEQIRVGGADRHGHRARGADEYDPGRLARLRRARVARAPDALAQCRHGMVAPAPASR